MQNNRLSSGYYISRETKSHTPSMGDNAKTSNQVENLVVMG